MIPILKKKSLDPTITKSTVIKLAIMIVSVMGVFLMTGLLYFRNDVKIIDGNEERTVYTTSADPYEILRENHIALEPYDRISFSGFIEGETTANLIIERAFSADVIDNGKKAATVYSVNSTVDALLKQFGITLGEYDRVTPALDEVLKKGQTISIDRAFNVTVIADNEEKTVKCLNDTVEQLIARAGVVVGKNDVVSESPDKVIMQPCEIRVSRVEIEYTVTETVSHFDTVYVTDNLSAIGTTRVITEGVEGVTEHRKTVTYVDGIKTDVKTETVVVSERTDEVIGIGAAVAEPYCKLDDPAIVLENGRPVDYEYIVSGYSTAYTAPAGSYTASGRLADIGTCAVNPNEIPYGSLLYIVCSDNSACYGYAIAADTGDGMMDGTIPVDLYMGSSEEHYYDSCDWGMRTVDIYVISVGNG